MVSHFVKSNARQSYPLYGSTSYHLVIQYWLKDFLSSWQFLPQ